MPFLPILDHKVLLKDQPRFSFKRGTSTNSTFMAGRGCVVKREKSCASQTEQGEGGAYLL